MCLLVVVGGGGGRGWGLGNRLFLFIAYQIENEHLETKFIVFTVKKNNKRRVFNIENTKDEIK